MEYDIVAIINRIKEVARVESDLDVAELLGLSRTALAERKRRSTIPYEEIVIFSDKKRISLHWLLTGNYETEEDIIRQRLRLEGATETEIDDFIKNKKEEEKPSQVAEECAIYNVKQSPELAEINRLLEEHPQDMKLVLKLLKGKKDIKEALEGFEIKKIKEQEG